MISPYPRDLIHRCRWKKEDLSMEIKIKSSHILEDLVYPFGGVTDLKLIIGVAGLIMKIKYLLML